MTKLTENFTLEEFQSVGFPKAPTMKEMFLLRHLAINLQIARKIIRRKMILTDCYRSKQRLDDLIHKGYHPSETTDHYFGQRIPLSSPKKAEQYGSVYELSVGAADFGIEDVVNTYEAFVLLAQSSIRGELNGIGQLIYYEMDAKRWIHLSNSPNILYSKEACECLFPKRQKYLISLDGGNTYKQWLKPTI